MCSTNLLSPEEFYREIAAMIPEFNSIENKIGHLFSKEKEFEILLEKKQKGQDTIVTKQSFANLSKQHS